MSELLTLMNDAETVRKPRCFFGSLNLHTLILATVSRSEFSSVERAIYLMFLSSRFCLIFFFFFFFFWHDETKDVNVHDFAMVDYSQEKRIIYQVT
jgi:hypothetical protein